MTRNELYSILRECGWETTPIHTLDKIWGRPFDGITEKITKKDEGETHAVTEESSTTACGQNPLHPRENCSWWQFGRCPTDCVHSATRLDL